MMEYQRIINLLDSKSNQLFRFGIKNCVEIDYDSCGKYSANSQIKFKTSMLNSWLCGYSDTYILVKGTINIICVKTPLPPGPPA